MHSETSAERLRGVIQDLKKRQAAKLLHYKSDCPDLLNKEKQEKSSGRKNAQPKYARSKQGGSKPVDLSLDHSQKRKVVVSEVVKSVVKDYKPSLGYPNSGTNAHIVASKEYFTSFQGVDNSEWNQTAAGFADGVVAQAEGFGTFLLATMVDDRIGFVFLEDVVYMPKEGCNLFFPGQTLNHGYNMSWNQDTKLFGISKDNTEIIRAAYEHQLWTFSAQNIGTT
ncbi:hypothetical protein PHPALM_28600 [Phytophthora palmivora]|uniref:Retrovirus-related Pol polyprotein from transposon TNT 1-94-like beta-barrel domain-containing protein n=1 Tax=Phytophthora palmivora TaxID=4796 RepID=A0A2P4X9S0_9STRA|nr:hypothetical protein PHPALM_28600 [Phytophthora palmivora]